MNIAQCSSFHKVMFSGEIVTSNSFKLGSGYSAGSGLLVLNAIQLVRLIARLIGDFQPFLANPRCCPNSYKKEIH